MKKEYNIYLSGSTYIFATGTVKNAELVENVYDVIMIDYHTALVESDFKARTENGVKIEKVLKQLVADRLNELGYSASYEDVVIDD